MRSAACFLVCIALGIPACTGTANQTADHQSSHATAPTTTASSGWVNAATGEEAPPVLVTQKRQSATPRATSATDPQVAAIAGQVANAAAAQWQKNSPNLPEPADLKLLLQTTLDALIAPNFDAYDKFLTARGATLNSALPATAEELHKRNDLGIPNEIWARYSDRQKCAAYWSDVDARGARWKHVDLGELRADSGMDTFPKSTSTRGVFSYAVYHGPGGVDAHNAWQSGDAPVAHVQFPAVFSADTVRLTFIFGFDPHAKKWFPHCLSLDFGDGRGCNMRI